MNKVIITIFIITASVTVESGANVFPARSPQHLIVLAEMEAKIFNILEEYSKARSNGIGLVNEYLEDFRDSYLKPTAHLNPSEAAVLIAKNPIMAYRMLRRYSKMLQNLHKEMTNISDSEFLTRIKSAKSKNGVFVNWPSDADLKDAMDALIRLHETYDFDLDEFISGNIMGTQTLVQLNTIHCQELGEFAVRSKLYYTGILWLEAALRKVEEFPGSGNLFEIQKSLKKANEAHDLAWGYRRDWEYNYFSRRLNETGNNKIRKSLRSVALENKGKHIPCTRDYLKFWELCSGKNFQTPAMISKLFCTYDSKSNPAWVIGPLKVEQLSLSPPIFQFYDILGEKAMETLKEESIPKLELSSTFRVNNVAVGRTSTVAFLNETSEVFHRVNRRIELMSGLKHTETEEIRVTAYAYGGFFEPHMDWRRMVRGSKYPNDYLASFIFSLDNVEIGGYTAFLNAGVAYKPIKGSAVVWYNLKKSCKTDPNTCHGGCPVVLGHKWSATKRPYTEGQIFSRPCGLNRSE